MSTPMCKIVLSFKHGTSKCDYICRQINDQYPAMPNVSLDASHSNSHEHGVSTSDGITAITPGYMAGPQYSANVFHCFLNKFPFYDIFRIAEIHPLTASIPTYDNRHMTFYYENYQFCKSILNFLMLSRTFMAASGIRVPAKIKTIIYHKRTCNFSYQGQKY